MRAVTLALAVAALALSAAPAAADRASDHFASLIGAEADTIGVTLGHDAHGWSMTVRPKPGADSIVVRVPEVRADKGSYLVFVAPGRARIAWVLTESPSTPPAATDGLVWIYDVRGTLERTVTVADLFTDAEREQMGSSKGWSSWVAERSGKATDPVPRVKAATLTVPARWGAPVVVNLRGKAASARRKH